MKRILVVDDTPDILSMMVAVLKLHNYHVVSACDATTALQAWALEGLPPFDLIISDIAMPDLSGFQLAEQIHKMERERERLLTPIVFLSAYTDASIQGRALVAGVSEVWTKPLAGAEFLKKVEKILEKS